METSNLISLLDNLDDDIDELEETLAPVTKHALGDTASKLPLLDKAQLYILITYAIESILFSYLRLNGTDAKEHAVFRELTRVKQYFQKIQDVERIGSTRENLSLDKVAAGRMISHVLTLALSSALIDKAGGLESNGKNQQQSTGNSQLQHIPASRGMSAIVKSEYPTERASSGQKKHASKKVKLEHHNSNDRKDNGDEATSNLMANPAAHSPPSFTASEHTGTVSGSNMAGKRRKRKKHQPHDASKGPGDSA